MHEPFKRLTVFLFAYAQADGDIADIGYTHQLWKAGGALFLLPMPDIFLSILYIL